MRFVLITLLSLFLSVTVAHADDIAAIKAAAKKNYSVPASSKTGQNIVTWYKLRQSDSVDFRTARAFITEHPEWPDIYTIRKNAEKSIATSTPPREIIDWFAGHDPSTVQGMDAYLKALISTGQMSKALKVLKGWWPDAMLTTNEQKEMISRYGKYLGSQDHERRLNHIIYDGQYTASRDLAGLLGRDYRALVEAKIALIEDKPNVNQLVAAVPNHLQNNEALMLARIQWRRKNGHDEGAIELLGHAPDTAHMANPEAWWQERHIMARRLIEEKKWGSAYRLVSQHQQAKGVPLADGEFLAGWLALRKIGKPWEAFKHFERLFNNVETPISRARGAYWAGLASDTLGYPDIANQWYQVAAAYQTTFYGQMAAQRINLPFGTLRQTPFNVTQDARNRFHGNAVMIAARLLHDAKQDYDAKQFFTAFIEGKGRSGLDYKMAADYASSLGYRDMAVRISKKAEKDGYVMPEYLFPVIRESLKAKMPIHPAFSHGVMRQESAFDQYARSSAGAMGLMQLMPGTAKETASKAGLPYSESRLMNDPAYNMTLGSSYMKRMLDLYDGNRTLAIAAYNAGPGNVAKWLKQNGDPRDPSVDEIDWIESIPVGETRNYVQRVTEAINVYARLLP